MLPCYLVLWLYLLYLFGSLQNCFIHIWSWTVFEIWNHRIWNCQDVSRLSLLSFVLLENVGPHMYKLMSLFFISERFFSPLCLWYSFSFFSQNVIFLRLNLNSPFFILLSFLSIIFFPSHLLPFKVNTGVTSEVCLLCYGYSFLHRYFNAILLPIILIFSLQSVLKKGFIYLFIYFWLCWIFIALLGLSLVVASRGYSLLWCVGFFLWRLLLLWSTGSRCAGFSGCSLRAQ